MRCEALGEPAAGGLVSPSAERNKAAVCEVLKRVLPASGIVLEISSGTGQHVAHFAAEMPGLTWQPSEREEALLPSIAQWIASCGVDNVRTAVRLDVTEQPWPVASAAAVVCLNMIHIAPWAAAEALVRGAREILSSGGVLFLYGPFQRDGSHTAPSNEAFDIQLRARNPEWGVRHLEDVTRLASACGFAEPEIVAMPANNLSLVFRLR